MGTRKSRALTASVFFATWMALPSGAQATSYTWNVASGDWATSTNWNPNGVPGPTDDATIANGGTVTVSAATTVNNLTLNTGSTINGGGSLAVDGLLTWASGTMGGAGTTTLNGGMQISGGGTRTLSRTMTLAAGTATFTGASANMTLSTASGVFINNSIVEFNTDGGGTQNLANSSGAVINNGLLRKTGVNTGTTYIDAAMTNNGQIQVFSGTLSMASAAKTSSATATYGVSPGATLVFATTHALAAGSSVSGAGAVNFTSGTTTVSGSYTVTGLTTISTTVNFEAAASPAAVTLNGSGVIGGAGAVSLSGLLTWTVGTMSGAGTTTLNAGMLILNGGTRTLSRTMTLAAGTATFTGAGAAMSLSTVSGVFINNSTVEFNTDGGGNQILTNGSGSVINNGLLRKTGVNSGTTYIDAAMTNNGPIQVFSGTLSMASAAKTSSGTASYDVSAGATLVFGANHTLAAGSSVSGAGAVNFTSGATTISGSYTLSGLTTILSTVNFEAAAGPAAVTVNGGTIGGAGALSVSGLFTWTSGTMGGAGTTTLNAGMLILNGGTRTLSRTMTLAGGTATFTGAGAAMTLSTASGVFVNNSTVEFTSDLGGNQNLTNSGGSVTNNGTLRKTAGNTGNTYIDPAFTNAGTVESLSGTLRFSVSFTQTAGVTRLGGGAITSTPTMNLQGGTLEGTGTLTATVNNTGGTVGPGLSAGQLSETGAYTQTAGGSFNAQIGGLTVGTQYDRLAVSGAATLAGTLNISLINAYVPNIGDSFVVMTAGSRSGDFTTVNGLPIAPGKAFEKTVSATNVTLTVVAVAVVAVCPNSIVEPGEQCDDGNSTAGDCCSITCQYEGGGSPCDLDAQFCTADTCNGSGTCTAGGNPCAGHNVGPACNDSCDETANACSGSDAPATNCDDTLFCNGADTCSGGTCSLHAGNPCTSGPECAQGCDEVDNDCFDAAGTPCTSDGIVCTLDECNGAGICNHPAGNSGTTCRPSGDACDFAEACTGTSTACPGDSFLASTIVCRGPADVCDVAEACTGTSAACPGDGFQSTATPCRASVAVCDAAEACTGTSATCPGDGFLATTTECRASAEACDAAEACTGTSAACPGDSFFAFATVCRASADVCDTAEACTGTSATCPGDGFLATTAECRASAGICDVAEACTGTSAACPGDGFQSTATPCRASVAVCDAAEACTGTSATCPGDGFLATTAECRASAGICDVAEACTGTSAACPGEGFRSTATPCRASVAVCDAAEVCTGTSSACPADIFASSASICRVSAGACDIAESCTGSSVACPSNALAASTAICRFANGICDVAETCTGLSAFCPGDADKPDGTSCDDLDACTTGDQCSGGLCVGGPATVCPLCEVCDAIDGCVAAVCPLCEVCDGIDGCVAAPRLDCKQSLSTGRSKFVVKDNSLNAEDRMSWKWSDGDATSLGELGTPTSTTDYALCVFAAPADRPVFRGLIPAGGVCSGKDCWTATGSKGFKYGDNAGAAEGAKKASVRIGEAGEARASYKGKGANLATSLYGMLAPPLPAPVLVQLQADGGACFEASYSNPIQNAAGSFRANSD